MNCVDVILIRVLMFNRYEYDNYRTDICVGQLKRVKCLPRLGT
jgi:hypothetical protein